MSEVPKNNHNDSKVSNYVPTAQGSNIVSGKGIQGNIFIGTQNNIYQQAPLLPSTDTPIQRKRDLKTLILLLEQIEVEKLDYFLEQAEFGKIHQQMLCFWEDFKAVIMASNFYVYNQELKFLILEFYNSWKSSLSYGQHFDLLHSNFYIMTPPKFMNDEIQKEWKIDYSNYQKAVKQTQQNFKKLLVFIKINYLEVDLAETNKVASDKYKIL